MTKIADRFRKWVDDTSDFEVTLLAVTFILNITAGLIAAITVAWVCVL